MQSLFPCLSYEHTVTMNNVSANVIHSVYYCSWGKKSNQESEYMGKRNEVIVFEMS